MFKKTVFYLMRHGQTDYNLKQIWQGSRIDAPLNETGRKQALELAEKVSSLNLELVVSSPLLRAWKTADIIAARNNLFLQTMEDFREADYGVAEGCSMQFIRDNYPQEWDAWIHFRRTKHHKTFPLSENMLQVAERAFGGLKYLYGNPETTIGIVTHAGVLGSMLSSLGLSDFELSNGCCFKVLYDGADFQYEGKTY